MGECGGGEGGSWIGDPGGNCSYSSCGTSGDPGDREEWVARKQDS